MTIPTPATSGEDTITRAARLGALPRCSIRRALAGCRRGLLAAGAVLGGAASGETVSWLYDVQVPVASQTEAERGRATRRALTEVLMRVTGASQVPVASGVAAALAAPSRYVLRFKFVRAPAAASGGNPAAPNGNGVLFDVRFDADAVLALLRDARLPIWGANRPVVLVWLAVRGGGRDHIVAASAHDRWARALRKSARRRGIATVLPVMDLRDRRLSTGAVWGFFWEDIEAASTRYRADLILVGRAALAENGWWIDWELRAPVRFRAGALDAAAFDAAGATPAKGLRSSTRRHDRQAGPEAAAQAAIDHVADALAARFAVRGGRARTFQATVRGAQTVRGYASLLDHFHSQEYIERVDVLAATPGTLEIRLHTRSTLGQLVELLAQGGQLAVHPIGERMEIAWRGRR